MIVYIGKLENTVKNVRLACFGRGPIFSVTVIHERDKKTRRETRHRYSVTVRHHLIYIYAVTVSRFFVTFTYDCNAYFRTMPI